MTKFFIKFQYLLKVFIISFLYFILSLDVTSASPEYWPVDDGVVFEMSQFSKSRTQMDVTTHKLIEQIIEKNKLSPLNKRNDQCELMNRIVTYIGLNVMSLGGNTSICAKNNEVCINPYRIIESQEVYKNGFFEGKKFDSELLYLVTDYYGRPIGISRLFTKSYAKSSGYYKILQHHRKTSENSNSLQELVFVENKPDSGSYLKIDQCYIKEIHLTLDDLYLERSLRYNQ